MAAYGVGERTCAVKRLFDLRAGTVGFLAPIPKFLLMLAMAVLEHADLFVPNSARGGMTEHRATSAGVVVAG